MKRKPGSNGSKKGQATTRLPPGREVVRIAPEVVAVHQAHDLFKTYVPPFDLTSDMLFVAALAPAEPLQRCFPNVPFLTLLGRAVLVIWFSRVHELCYQGISGEEHCIKNETRVPYNELNVIALLGRRAFFVPGIYATSELSLRLGHRYGMPKQPIRMNFAVHDGWIDAAAVKEQEWSFVRARLLESGRWPAWLLSRWRPWWSWPIRFPSGSMVRGLVRAIPRAHLVFIHTGTLAVEEPWLPEPVSLLPFGLYVPHLGMHLPAPEGWGSACIGMSHDPHMDLPIRASTRKLS